jgi:hypothetical protein
VSASEAEVLEMRETVQQVFDKQEETKEEVVGEKERDFDGSNDGSGDGNSNDSDDDDSDDLPDTWTTEEGHTVTRAKNYSCSGTWKDVANLRRPTGPEATSAGAGPYRSHIAGRRVCHPSGCRLPFISRGQPQEVASAASDASAVRWWHFRHRKANRQSMAITNQRDRL